MARVITSYIAGQEEISILELQGEKKGASNEGTHSWMQEKDFILAVGLIIQVGSLLCVRLPPSFEGKLFTLSFLCYLLRACSVTFSYTFFFLTSIFGFSLFLISEKFPASSSVLPSRHIRACFSTNMPEVSPLSQFSCLRKDSIAFQGLKAWGKKRTWADTCYTSIIYLIFLSSVFLCCCHFFMMIS